MNIRRLPIVAAALASALTVSQSDALDSNQLAGLPPLFAVLSGGNEVTNDGQANVGDPNGRGSATVILHDSNTLCFAILVTGIDQPTAAHIHQAPAGVKGPIVVGLVEPSDGNPGTSTGCTTEVDQEVLKAIRNEPAGFYVNVHTVQFPDGALRGQLF